MQKQLLFSFEELASGDKAINTLKSAFTRAGAQVVEATVAPKTRRSSGISYKEVSVVFADSQTLMLRVKQTGDIYEALLNGKVIPIKNQDNHLKAVAEIAKLMDAGRAKFQAALAKTATKLPPSIRTAAPNLEKLLDEKIVNLTEAITVAKETLAEVIGTAVPA